MKQISILTLILVLGSTISNSKNHNTSTYLESVKTIITNPENLTLQNAKVFPSSRHLKLNVGKFDLRVSQRKDVGINTNNEPNTNMKPKPKSKDLGKLPIFQDVIIAAMQTYRMHDDVAGSLSSDISGYKLVDVNDNSSIQDYINNYHAIGNFPAEHNGLNVGINYPQIDIPLNTKEQNIKIEPEGKVTSPDWKKQNTKILEHPPVLDDFDNKAVRESSGKFGIDSIDVTKAKALGTLEKKKLHFPATPDGERIQVEIEHLHEHKMLPLAIFSMILGALQPSAFPIEMVKEAIEGRLAFHVLLLQVMKIETLLVLWMVCWLIAASYVPYSSLGQICCRRRKFLQRLENHSSASSLEHADKRRRRQEKFSIPCFTFTINILLLVFILNIGLMLAGNEQANRSIDKTANQAHVVFEDMERFVRNSEMQIAFVTATSLEIALDAADKDLQDAEKLLGKPIQDTYREFYNLENTFSSIKLIQQDSIEISKIVKAIKDDCKASQEAGDKLQRRLEDLIPLVRNIHQVCADRDGPLCETLSATGLDVTFNVKEIIADEKLNYLGGISSRTNFNVTLFEAERNFEDIDRRIALETTGQRAVIRNSLERHRVDIHKRLRSLEDTSRSTITSIKRVAILVSPYLEAIVSWEFWRYLTTFIISVVLFISWLFLLCGSPCCCCTQATKTSYAIIGAGITATASIFVWLLGSSALLLGAHSESFICRAFHDSQYQILGMLVDDRGLLFPLGGLLKQRLNLNESLRISDALRAMENNKTVYKAFNLKSLLDIEALTDHKTWSDVNHALSQLQVQRDLKLLTPAMENTLLDFTNAGGVNLTAHRAKLSRPVIPKDLDAFLDQIYTISKHVRDIRTKTRLENLAFKLRDIIDTDYKAMNDIQDRLIYHITALDVLLKPLVKRAEYILGNLTKFQLSMNFELETIAKSHIANYTSRLEDYLVQFRANVLYEIKHRTAKTGPLWNIFTAIRVTLCDGCVDGINALSFSCYLSILVMVSLQPVLWQIVKYFREIQEENLNAMLPRSVSEELIHQNPQNWQTPRSVHGTGSPDTIVRDLEESVWVSPRPSSDESYLPPPPPRQPSETTVAIEQYATPTTYSERVNWTSERDISPALSSTRRWI